MTNYEWPKEVPVLSGRDICRNEFNKGDRCCLLGWTAVVFDASADVRREVRLLLREETEGIDVLKFNDDPRNSKATIASVWNKAMRRLGYTEITEK